MMRRRLVVPLLTLLCALLFSVPVLLTLSRSLRFDDSFPTLRQYGELLVTNYTALTYFWNAMLYATVTTVACIVISFPLGFLFAQVKLPGLDALFFVYIVVMMLPFQATLLPNYIQLRDWMLLDTRHALTLPFVFSPFAVFLMRQFMKGIPKELLEYCTLESNSVFALFRYAVFPQIRAALAALAILLFSETWNMVEQPLIFTFKNPEIHPLSVALSRLPENVSYAASVVYMVPVLLLFFAFKETLARSMERMRW